MDGVVMNVTKKQSGRFSPLIFITCGLTIGIWIVHMLMRQSYQPGHPLRLVVTALLVASLAFFIIVYVKVLSSLDEFQKRIHFLALAVGFPLALILIWGIGYFRAEGLFQNNDPRDLPSVMLLAYGIGFGVAWWKYR